MEFLRFGSSIPGSYWGCCAVCIIQNFKVNPDAKAAIQLVSGDGGGPITRYDGEATYVGGTWREIFEARIRLGTFSDQNMPNHTFFAVLEDSQIKGTYGKAWLAILREHGFEFVRTVDNSVYTGQSLTRSCSSHPNHIFALYRNIGAGRIKDPFTPPKEWTNLPDPYNGDMSIENTRKVQTDFWNAHTTKTFSESDMKDKIGVANMWVAGLRSTNPQEPLTVREYRRQQEAPTPSESLFPTKAAKDVAVSG